MSDHKHAASGTLSSLYDLPRIYDILHGPGTKEDIASALAIARRWVAAPAQVQGRWLEPACGSGRLVIAAAKHAESVIGIDMNAAMIRYAKKHTPTGLRKRVFFKRGDIRHLEESAAADSVDFAFNPINTIRHLPDDAHLRQHLNSVAHVLKPGGVYAVGLSLSAYGLECENEDRWEGERGRARVIQNVQYEPARGGKGRGARHERVFSHLTVYEGKRVRDIDDAYQLRSYNLEQWLKVLEKSRLRMLASVAEDGTEAPPMEPGYCISVLVRRDDPRMMSASDTSKSRWHA